MAAITEIRKMESVVVNLTVTREFMLRVWIATQLFRLGALVLGGRVEINEQD
jgi:hypothetical protein